ncbi:MAG: YkgJ family cysteine cluster protein [Nitrospinae bacterium]|nr:YkgJ family cysteine cluster protein [Nitrospinota bacterium]
MSKKKIKNPWDQCKNCLPAKCCTYFSVEIDAPETRKDHEAMLWQIAHKGVSIYIYRKAWYLMVDTVCGFLTPENKCAIYETRPYICREHSIDTCEYTGDDYGFTEHFKSYDDLLAWIKENTNFRFKDRIKPEAPSKSTVRPLQAATA